MKLRSQFTAAAAGKESGHDRGRGGHGVRRRSEWVLRAYYEALGFTHAGDVDCLPRSTRPGHRAASRYQRAING